MIVQTNGLFRLFHEVPLLLNLQDGSTALTAVALQDHLVKSLGLTHGLGPRQIGLGPAARSKQRKDIKSTIETGRFGRSRCQKRLNSWI